MTKGYVCPKCGSQVPEHPKEECWDNEILDRPEVASILSKFEIAGSLMEGAGRELASSANGLTGLLIHISDKEIKSRMVGMLRLMTKCQEEIDKLL